MAPPAPVLTPPRFGTAAMVVNGSGKLLVRQRFGSHGAGEPAQKASLGLK